MATRLTIEAKNEQEKEVIKLFRASVREKETTIKKTIWEWIIKFLGGDNMKTLLIALAILAITCVNSHAATYEVQTPSGTIYISETNGPCVNIAD